VTLDYLALMSACEIVSLYSDINTRCIEHGFDIKKPKNQQFVELTRIMNNIKQILKGIKLKISNSNNLYRDQEHILLNFWTLYS